MNTLAYMHTAVESLFIDTLERFPRLGYLFASVPTTSAAASILMDVRCVLTYVSLLLGIIVGLYTWRAQYLQIKKLKRDLRRLDR